MKVRLYHDERVSAKDAPDAWSIYCPYPKKYQRVTGIKGVYLGCKPTDEGMIRCCWESMEVGQKVSLGKRVDVSSTPMAIQITFHRIECVYQHACQVIPWRHGESFKEFKNKDYESERSFGV